MQSIQLKLVTIDNLSQLQEIGRTTFFQAFAATNSEENMAQYLAEGFSEEKLTQEISNENSQFYFAIEDDKVIGYLKVNTGISQDKSPDNKGFEIERIYVLREFYGKKVGQVLYEKAIQLSVEYDADYVWLGVWEENLRAIHFYRKNGFVESGRRTFQLGNDKQNDLVMTKILKD